MNAGQDPYFIHCYRINFDGTGLRRSPRPTRNHTVTLVAGPRSIYVDHYSRVDLPPVLGAAAHERSERS